MRSRTRVAKCANVSFLHFILYAYERCMAKFMCALLKFTENFSSLVHTITWQDVCWQMQAKYVATVIASSAPKHSGLQFENVMKMYETLYVLLVWRDQNAKNCVFFWIFLLGNDVYSCLLSASKELYIQLLYALVMLVLTTQTQNEFDKPGQTISIRLEKWRGG